MGEFVRTTAQEVEGSVTKYDGAVHKRRTLYRDKHQTNFGKTQLSIKQERELKRLLENECIALALPHQAAYLYNSSLALLGPDAQEISSLSGDIGDSAEEGGSGSTMEECNSGNFGAAAEEGGDGAEEGGFGSTTEECNSDSLGAAAEEDGDGAEEGVSGSIGAAAEEAGSGDIAVAAIESEWDA